MGQGTPVDASRPLLAPHHLARKIAPLYKNLINPYPVRVFTERHRHAEGFRPGRLGDVVRAEPPVVQRLALAARVSACECPSANHVLHVVVGVRVWRYLEEAR
jgi:hypothetical protein